MITPNYPLKKTPAFDFSIVAPRERIIFFDIETTGLSRDRSMIYLIGTVTYEDGSWNLRQYFAESPDEEPLILKTFLKDFELKKRFGRVVLVTFNGDSFDIPFVNTRLGKYNIGYDIRTGTVSLDLLRKIRPYRKLAALNSCSLKTIEKLCGINREDIYSGGELIYVYEEYVRMSRIEKGMLDDNYLNKKLRLKLLDTLLLHNAEDIADMPFIMDILGYEELFKGSFEVTGSTVYKSADTGREGTRGSIWDIQARLTLPLPHGIYLEKEDLVISISEEDKELLNFTVRILEGELRYFFDDYKNYYYLPAEDYAVHKSVGEFVQRSARKQATASTCYIKKNGAFIPAPVGVFANLFYKDKKKGPAYAEISEIIDKNTHNGDTNITKRYILALLEEML